MYASYNKTKRGEKISISIRLLLLVAIETLKTMFTYTSEWKQRSWNFLNVEDAFQSSGAGMEAKGSFVKHTCQFHLNW